MTEYYWDYNPYHFVKTYHLINVKNPTGEVITIPNDGDFDSLISDFANFIHENKVQKFLVEHRDLLVDYYEREINRKLSLDYGYNSECFMMEEM